MYVSSIGIFSEGADLVITIQEIADGHYAAAVGLLPFIPGPVVDSLTKVAVRTLDGAPILTKVADVVRPHRPNINFVTKLGYVDRGYLERAAVYYPNGSRVLFLGTPQETLHLVDGVLQPTTHASTIRRLAEEQGITGTVEYITFDVAMRTAVGRVSSSTTRPDLVIIRANGKVDLIEVLSPSDNLDQVIAKLEAARLSLPIERRGEIAWHYPD